MRHILLGITLGVDGEGMTLISDDAERDAQSVGLSVLEYRAAMKELNPHFDAVVILDKWLFDDDGNEYYIGRDGRRHYTRDEG